ncbi:MAG: response regulator [Thermovenabulum sp.]|uniref:response regulator n=1 Tax=Thermovenabulum sp. TaxID=3100335 RepID=UPI003C7DDD68
MGEIEELKSFYSEIKGLIDVFNKLDDDQLINKIKELKKREIFEEEDFLKLKIIIAEIEASFTRDKKREKVLEGLLELSIVLEEYFPRENCILIFSSMEDPYIENFIYELKNKNMEIYLKTSEEDFLTEAYLIIPDAVLIFDDSEERGKAVFQNLKDNSFFENILLLVVGSSSWEKRLYFINQGAIDYIDLTQNNEINAQKIKNITKISSLIKKCSVKDPLTGLFSQNLGLELSRVKFDQSKIYDTDFTMVLIDIDDMKNINERYGKTSGNRLLKEIAFIIKENLKEGEMAFRYKEDELFIVFPEVDINEAFDRLSGIKDIAYKMKEIIGFEFSFTAGIVKKGKALDTLDELIDKAKKCVEMGKEKKKGEIYIWPEEAEKKDKKILIIEPDNMTMEVLKKRYELKGYKVFTALSANDALEIFEKEGPKVIITEFLLPGMDGDILTKRLKEMDRNTKVIVLTSQKMEMYIERAMKAGADDFITKPFSPVELDYKIEKFA